MTPSALSRFDDGRTTTNRPTPTPVSCTNGVPIIVERAMYWDAGGQPWAAGTDALATKLQ